MNTATLRLSILSVAILLLASLFPVLSGAQERSNADTNSVEAEADATLDANYNNTRSNRSSVAPAADTNVCDGATCADGSCVATPDMCGAEETAADSVCNGFLCDGGECVASAAMCGITEAEELAADSVCSGHLCDDGQCVSDAVWCGVDFDFEINATEMAADSVCNGYLCDDGTCVSSEPMCAIDFDELPAMAVRCPADSPIRCGDGSCASEAGVCRAIESRMTPDTDSDSSIGNDVDGDGVPTDYYPDADGDGFGEPTNRAQNHNSSRSNRTSGAAYDDFNDPDDDGDGLPTDAARGGVDKSSPLLFDTLRNNQGDADTETVGENDDTTGTAQGRAFLKIDDIKGEVREDPATGERRLSRIAVAARDLRNWTTEDREAFTRLRDEIESNTPEAASLRITEQLLADDRIEAIEATETEARVEYRTTMRLLGFIPLERNVTARAEADGTVEIDYPWYRFLSATPDNQRINTLLLDTLDIVVLVPGRAG